MARHKLNRADLNPDRDLVVAPGTLIGTYEVRMGDDGKPFLVKAKLKQSFICAVWRTNSISTAVNVYIAYTAEDLSARLEKLKINHPELTVDVYIKYYKNGKKTFSQTLT